MYFKENILYVKFGDNVEIDLDYAKSMVKDRLILIQGNDVLSLADASSIRKINKEARDYFSSDQARKGVLAMAFVSDNPMTNMIANFFIAMNISRTKFPTKLFSQKRDAEKWLRSLNF